MLLGNALFEFQNYQLEDFQFQHSQYRFELYRKFIFPKLIVHYATSAMKRFLTSVSLQHEPKASDVITLVKKTFFTRVSYEILYHEV